MRKILGDLFEILGITGETILPEEPQPLEVMENDYIYGGDILGAVTPVKGKIPQRAGFVIRKAPSGRTYSSLVLNKNKRKDATTSIANARDAGKRAVSLGKKLLASLSKAPLPAVVKTKVKGLVSPPKKKAGAFLTSAKLKQIANNAIKSGDNALKSADKHATLVTNLVTRKTAGIQKIQKALSQPHASQTKVKGDDVLGYLDYKVVDTAYEIIGAQGGYIEDGSKDPLWTDEERAQWAAEHGGASSASSTKASADTSVSTDVAAGITKPTMETVRAQLSESAMPDPGANDQTVYQELPTGAVVFDGSRPFSDLAVGSWQVFFGPKTDMNLGDGLIWRGQSWHSSWGNDRPPEWAFKKGGKFVELWQDGPYRPLTEGESWTQATQRNSMKEGRGPLVGNPGSVFAGLRYLSSTDQWFWFRDKAPQWATAAEDNAAFNQALLDYQAQVAAAAADAAAQAAQNRLDEQLAAELARQQAVEDAQMARDQQAQEAQQAQWEQQFAQQQAQLQLQAQQAQLEYTKQAGMYPQYEEYPAYAEEGEGYGEGEEGFTPEEMQQSEEETAEAQAFDEEA